MKGFRCAAVMFLAMVLVFAMPLAVFGDAIIDEDGNIIQENVELEGGIITLDVELDLSFWPDWGFGSFSGTVVESHLEGFLSVQDAGGDIVNFRIIPHLTFFAHGEPSVGDFVTGFYDMNLPVPMIYPPQFTATAFVMPGEAPPFFTVARFGPDHVSTDNVYRLNIGEDTLIFLQDGQVIDYVDGVLMIDIYPVDTVRTMLIEYTISHRDIAPTTIFPDRITVLFEPIMAFPVIDLIDPEVYDFIEVVTLPYEFDEDELPVEIYVTPALDEIDWGAFDVIVNLGDRYMGVVGATTLALDGSILPNYVSLRAFIEFLGGQVAWQTDGFVITILNPNPLHSGQQIVTSIGSSSITVDGSPVTLTHAPRLVDARTFVHLSFFREALGFNNAFFEGGNVTIDNFERME